MPNAKVIAGIITGLAVYALTKLGVSLDPQLEQAINVAAALLAAYLVPEGPVDVVTEDSPETA